MTHRTAVFLTNRIALLSLLLTLSTAAMAQDALQARPDWGQYFEKYDAIGTIVVLDERVSPPRYSAYDVARAEQRFSPASTYKIPHALFALDAGLVVDEFQTFEWDGTVHSYAPQNQDQNLRSAMRNSALWVFEIFAGQLGEEKSRAYLERIEYGNQDPRTDSGAYWVEGELAVSATEQVAMLQRLYRNDLPFSVEHQLLVKDVLINQAEKDWILRAKTGWQSLYGWWVGWVERVDGPVFFALNIDTPNGMADVYKREAIATEVLRSIEALPRD